MQGMLYFTGLKKSSELTVVLDSGKTFVIDLSHGTKTVHSGNAGANTAKPPITDPRSQLSSAKPRLWDS